MKKKILIILSIIVAFIFGGVLSFIVFKDKGLSKLPKPELTGGERGSLGIDKNINEQTIDKYLNRRILIRILFILLYGYGFGYMLAIESSTIQNLKIGFLTSKNSHINKSILIALIKLIKMEEGILMVEEVLYIWMRLLKKVRL